MVLVLTSFSNAVTFLDSLSRIPTLFLKSSLRFLYLKMDPEENLLTAEYYFPVSKTNAHAHIQKRFADFRS